MTRAVPLGVDGTPEIVINTDEAPQEKKGAAKHPAVVGLVEKLSKAPVGAWIIVPEPVAKYKAVAFTLAGMHRRGLFKGITAYRDGAGRTIVKKNK